MSQASSSSRPAPPSMPPVRAARPRGARGSLLVFLLAGVIAGGAGLATVTILNNFFNVPDRFANISANDEEGQAELAAAEVDTKHRLLCFWPVLRGGRQWQRDRRNRVEGRVRKRPAQQIDRTRVCEEVRGIADECIVYADVERFAE